jgi:serine/threonine protein kinase
MDTPALPTEPAPPEPAFAARVQSLKQLSALYDQALAMHDPARQAWLAALQAAGSPHAPALLRMLAGGTADNADRLPDMDAPAAWLSSSAAPAFAAGRNFGHWRLLRPLGAGGMAEVWLAERNEGTLHRQAAVKLLQCDFAGRKRDSFLHRFARERDILAALHHVHIAALYEAGIDAEGQPWLALEYVDGVPITRWCDEHAVPLRDRLRLFLQVLDAVAHAHANLVMHRDLKPSNILVTPGGQVRLLDFGIAALVAHEGAEHEATELTRNAGAPMTPLYASPNNCAASR